jgi:hypothetical protein
MTIIHTVCAIAGIVIAVLVLAGLIDFNIRARRFR